MTAPLWMLMGTPSPETTTVVAGRGYLMSVALWRSTVAGALVENISDLLVGGKVELNLDRDIKLTATLELRDPYRVSAYSDYLTLYMTRVFDDSRDTAIEQLGIYTIPISPEKLTIDDSLGSIQGNELTWLLANGAFTDTSNTPATTVLTTEIAAAITAGGLTRQNIPTSAVTTPVAQSFPIGTTYLEKCNTLLDQLGWYHLGMDLDGRISTLGAPQNLASKTVWRTITDDDLLAPPEVQPTGQEIYNQVIVINDDNASAPLYSVATNSDPYSPTSTVQLGITKTRPAIHISGPTTQAALDAIATRYLALGRTFYRVCKLKLFHDPSALTAHQVLSLNLTGKMAKLNGKWLIRTASLGLTTNEPLSLEINQVTDDVNGITI